LHHLVFLVAAAVPSAIGQRKDSRKPSTGEIVAPDRPPRPNLPANTISTQYLPSTSYVDNYTVHLLPGGGDGFFGGTDIGNHADDGTTTVALPFPYTLYGQTFSSANVSSNGAVEFAGTSSNSVNQCLPADANFNFAILPYWDDLRTDAGPGCNAYPEGCGIFTSVGSAEGGGRVFFIDFRTVYASDTSQRAHFGLALYENQPRFVVFYGTLDQGNSSATAGVQMDDGHYTQYFCNGSGGAAAYAQSYNLCPRARSDFNHDHYPDLVLFKSDTHQTAIWFLNNNNFMSSVYGPTLPAGWNVVDSADFDGDGNEDYVLFNPSTRQTAIWYLNGTSFMSSAFGPTLPTNGWVLGAVSDFNNDLHPDYVLYQAATGRTALWFLNNNVFTYSVFGPLMPHNFTYMPRGVVDFNHDTIPDYFYFDVISRRTAIWLSNQPINQGFFSGPTPPSGWQLIGVADFNTDGVPDYLLFNASTRKTAIWYLSDAIVFVSSAYGPTTPPNWNIVVP
jgi:hypothetical protein